MRSGGATLVGCLRQASGATLGMRWTTGLCAWRARTLGSMAGAPYLIIALLFGLATGIIGRAKGSSFFLWFLIGTVLPFFGLIAAILYRSEHTEPERQCPTCRKTLKLHVQVCPRCGTDLYLPDPSEVRPGPAHRST
jgi:hypothetical protein